MKSLAALCLLAMSCTHVHADTPKVLLCGRQLANAREWLCYQKNYNNKRGSPQHNVLDSILAHKTALQWPWISRGFFSASWSRHKRSGIADECCLKSCTTEVILSYC